VSQNKQKTTIETNNSRNKKSSNNTLSIEEIKELSAWEQESVFEYEQNKLKDYFKNDWFDISKQEFLEEFFSEINKFRKQKNISDKENQDNTRWDQLTKETFFEKPKEMIDLWMDNFGFIPEELYTKLVFVTWNDFQKSARFFNLLKSKEDKIKKQLSDFYKDNPSRIVNEIIKNPSWFSKSKEVYEKKLEEIRKIRNQFLKHIFLDRKGKKNKKIAWILNSVKNPNISQISLDTNGIFIKLDWGKKWKIFSHFPYEQIDNQLLNYWLESKWISQALFLEIKSRQFSKNSEIKKQIELKQLEILYTKISNNKNFDYNKSIEFIVEKIIENPKNIAEILKKENIIIPDIVFDEILEKNKIQDTVFILFNFAENINLSFIKQEFISSLTDYSTTNFVNSQFVQRVKVIDKNSGLYNAYKALNKALSIDLPKNSLVWDSFYIFKSEKDKKTGLNFVEVLTDRWITRNLIKENKHVNFKARKNVNSLKEFSFEKVKNIEVLYNSFLLAEKSLKQLENPNTQSNKNIQDILSFFLNYLPQDFKKLSKIADNIQFINDENKKQEYIKDFLKYSNIALLKIKFSLEKFIERWQNFNVLQEYLEKRELTLDFKFLEKLKEKWIKSYAYDEQLSSSNEKIEIVEIKKQKTNVQDYSINFFSEASAINALNLKQNKKVIIVSGWCKQVDINWISSLDIFSNSVIKYSMENYVNLSIPWTQSWIWVSMSKKYLDYKKKFKFNSADNKLRMFAISPRNNMTDTDYESSSKYAPNPVDQIYIPYDADWSITDKNIINAGYFWFIKQAELVYNRLDRKKERLHIIGNWGLFTIAELISSMENNSDVLIVNKTGRFSDLASILLDKKNLATIVMWVSSMGSYADLWDLISNIAEISKQWLDDYEELKQKDFWDISEFKEFFEKNKDKKIESIDNLFDDLVKYQEENSLNTNPKQILYWIYLIKFLKLAINKKPEVVDLENLDKYLNW